MHYFCYLCDVMKPYRLIRWGRIAVQTCVTVVIAAAVAVGAPCVLSRLQLIPAIAACATVWLAAWVVLTLLFGRIYCSTVCPTGALMALFSKILRKPRSHFSYAAPSSKLRLAMFLTVLLCALFGVSAVVSLFDPYSAFARMVLACARPAVVGISGFVVAGVTLAAIMICCARRGRIICNTVCPVGTVLGTISRISFFHTDINTDLCVNCGRCRDVCSAQCIDLNDHVVDQSRCIVCFDCLDVCPADAITFRRGRHQLSIPMMQRVVDRAGVSATSRYEKRETGVTPIDRRSFLIAAGAAIGAGVTATAAGQRSSYVKGAVKLIPLNYVTPPGASSREDFLRRCTACGACIATCPESAIVQSTNQFGVRHALTPVMNFPESYCSFECVRCTEVCPTKALSRLTLDEKRRTAIGRARICATNCRLYVNGIHCSICAKVCPKRAISIVRDNDGRRVPVVEPELCIGCGLCSNACPSKPYKAIVIEGL